MKLSVKAFAIACGVLWGGGMLATGALNLRSRSYGRHFLGLMSSLYPGYKNTRTFTDVLVGAGYGFVDGAVSGAAFASLYNLFAGAEGPAGANLARHENRASVESVR